MAPAPEFHEKSSLVLGHLLHDVRLVFQLSEEMKPGDFEVLNDFGFTLIELSRAIDGHGRRDLLTEAKRICEKAEAARPGLASYNLACIAALMGDQEACQRWLELWKETAAGPSLEHARRDADLDYVRGKRWFDEIVGGGCG